MPHAVQTVLQGYPGLAGLFVAAVFSGSLSGVAASKLTVTTRIPTDKHKPGASRKTETKTPISPPAAMALKLQDFAEETDMWQAYLVKIDAYFEAN
ncbi:hypothetical protein HPB52_002908 [Rhipicephalus sanguineus]|uniref:Uncharacterized protein n=1 Tax=Rhipicephalus sanguineus TaxID=34632 RepID=A0A9D4Q4M6_RHISA|nr:hypothetical protein HPB52_002908 [Rhipicephalus sanguineus]